MQLSSYQQLTIKEVKLENFKHGALSVTIRIEDGKAFMDWLGQSDSRNPAVELNPYLDSLVENLNVPELTIRFNDLEYMNSSTVPPIIQLLKKLNSKEINTTITYNVESKWQAASFKALDSFSKVLNYINVKGG